jgi:hypothetical protein
VALADELAELRETVSEELAELRARVDELEAKVDPENDDSDGDGEIDDDTVRDWVKSQIALAGGQYVTPEREARNKERAEARAARAENNATNEAQ